MFEQSLVSDIKTRQTWTAVLALVFQVAIVGIMLAIPLFFVQSLPMEQFASVLLAPPPPPPPPPPAPPPAQARARAVQTAPRKFDPSKLMAPRAIPKEVAQIKDLQDAPPVNVNGVVGGVPGGVPGGVIGGVIGGVLAAVPSPAPPPPPAPKEAPKPAAPSRLRVGGQVQAAKLVKQVEPEYPFVARQARIAGVVRLKAIIGMDGTVQDLSLLSGQPLLVNAAMDAVRHWIYKPTYLNGVPVEVITEVDVKFRLTS